VSSYKLDAIEDLQCSLAFFPRTLYLSAKLVPFNLDRDIINESFASHS